MTKDRVRQLAGELDLRTATKPDSQDVCFIHSRGGRRTFLGDRISLAPAELVDVRGRRVGEVASVELVTIGQRRGLDLGGDEQRRYVVDIDRAGGVVTVGHRSDLLTEAQGIDDLAWSAAVVDGPLLFQCSAHGRTRKGHLEGVLIVWDEPQPKVAVGQSIAVYVDDVVVGGGTAGAVATR